ncbi:hypothetical protein EOM81_01080 [bacterium]|nr:hypothetical protein [bacterium]
MGSIKSQNLSIMLTDMQGYSETVAGASREELIDLIRKHNKLMRPVIEFYRGKIIKSIGDALLCSFPSATDAVISAIIIQLLLKEYNKQQTDKNLALNLRIVINSGDVTLEDNDIFGSAVNITARMEKLECFPGGSIGISESTYLLMDKHEIVSVKIGPKSLKGVSEPITVYEVPLEKQKLNHLPIQLLELVERVVNTNSKNSDGSTGGAVFSEWSESVSAFLKQANWGENLNKASEQINKVQKKLVNTFGQKTVLETKKTYKDASLKSRIKSGVIDLIFVLVFIMAINFLWWVAQPILFGAAITNIQTTDLFGETIKTNMARPMGFFESLIDFNIRNPIIFVWAYLSVMLKYKKATLGQIAANTAVINEEGSDDLSWSTALKRGIINIISFLTVFGLLMFFVGEKKTLHDLICKTRVVE